MGLESANYKVLSRKCNRDALIQTLLSCPNVTVSEENPQAGEFSRYEMKTEEFLIEFQLFPEKEDNLQTLSIRIALCNPRSVLIGLHNIFSTFLEKCSSRLEPILMARSSPFLVCGR